MPCVWCCAGMVPGSFGRPFGPVDGRIAGQVISRIPVHDQGLGRNVGELSVQHLDLKPEAGAIRRFHLAPAWYWPAWTFPLQAGDNVRVAGHDFDPGAGAVPVVFELTRNGDTASLRSGDGLPVWDCHALVSRYREGDEEARLVLARRLQQMLAPVVPSAIRKHTDLVGGELQEKIRQVLPVVSEYVAWKLEKFKMKCCLKSWATTVAVREIRDMFAVRPEKLPEGTTRVPLADQDPESLGSSRGRQESPQEEELMDADLPQVARRLLQRIRQRQIELLREGRGIEAMVWEAVLLRTAPRKIAEVFGLEQGNVYYWRSRLREWLCRELGGEA